MEMNFVHTKSTRIIHTLSALLLIGLFIIGNYMTGLDDSDQTKTILYRAHSFSGMILVILTIARVVLRIKNSHPIPEGLSGWNEKLYSFVHWAIYINLIVIGLSGMGVMIGNDVNFLTILPSNLNRDLPAITVHGIAGKLILVFVFLHIAGVMRYQFTKGDILSRMGINLPK